MIYLYPFDIYMINNENDVQGSNYEYKKYTSAGYIWNYD